MVDIDFLTPPQPADEANAAAAERRLGRRIPNAYREFLLQERNGGRPVPNVCILPEARRVGVGVTDFLGVGHPDDTDLVRVAVQYRDRVPDDMLPVAHAEGGNLVCLSLGDHEPGAVFFWDHEEEADEGEPPTRGNLHWIAGSLRDFAAALRPMLDVAAEGPVARDAWIDPERRREVQEPGDDR
jgi:SMI1-KNR4 cell-wall